jgi:hypothetical protein
MTKRRTINGKPQGPVQTAMVKKLVAGIEQVISAQTMLPKCPGGKMLVAIDVEVYEDPYVEDTYAVAAVLCHEDQRSARMTFLVQMDRNGWGSVDRVDFTIWPPEALKPCSFKYSPSCWVGNTF